MSVRARHLEPGDRIWCPAGVEPYSGGEFYEWTILETRPSLPSGLLVLKLQRPSETVEVAVNTDCAICMADGE